MFVPEWLGLQSLHVQQACYELSRKCNTMNERMGAGVAVSVVSMKARGP